MGIDKDPMGFDRSYAYAALWKAIRKLVLPNPSEPYSIMWAMHEVMLGVPRTGDLGYEDVNKTRDRLYALMDTHEAQEHPDAAEKGALLVRAEELTDEEREEFSRLVLELRAQLRTA
jgi:hypothetical protein